ncbi:MAG: SMC family ATPase [Anaerolineae bacterium]
MIRIRRIVANNFKQLDSVDLALPPNGRFLVQGRNEAGKSSLFEALYFGLFGKGLLKSNVAKQEDLIGYGTERLHVQIWLETRDAMLKITRTLSRTGRGNSVILEIETNDGAYEEIRGATAVTNRVEHELRLDADSLLNTCFVEQKRLDKLEGLARNEREKALSRLLNTDKLQELAESLKIKSEEREKLTWHEQRRDLAAVQADLPVRQAELREIETRLELAQAADDLGEALRADDDIHRLEAAIMSLQAQAEALDARQTEVEAVTEAGKRLREVQERLTRLDRQRQDLADEAARLTAARAAVAALPEALAEVAALGRVSNRLARLDMVATAGERSQAQAQQLARQAQDAQARQAELDAERARGAALDADIRQAETALADAEAARRGRQEMDELGRWRDAYRGATAPQRAQAELADARTARSTLLTDFSAAIAAFRESPPKSLSAALDAATAVLTRLEGMFLRLNDVAYRVGRLEGEQDTLRQAAAAEQKRLTAAEKRLREMGITPPADEPAADTRLAALEDLIAGRQQSELEEAANAARDSLSRLGGERDAVARRIRTLAADVQGQDVGRLQADAERAGQRAARAAAIRERWLLTALAPIAARGLTREGLAEALSAAKVTAASRARDAQALTDMEQRHARNSRLLVELEAETKALYDAASAADAALPSWSETLSPETLEPYRSAMGVRYRELGGQSVTQQRHQVAGEIGNAEAKRSQARKIAADRLASAQQRLRRAHVADLLPDTEMTTVREAHAHLAEHHLDAAALKSAQNDILKIIGGLERQRDDLDRKLRLGEEELNLEQCEAELDGMRHEMAVRERGRSIVERAHTRIKEKVLPATVAYMSRILPQLTSGRYEIVQLSPDFKIEVLDERVGDNGGFRPKDVFSGGCRDQVSLALRLGFALATLPEERGAAPSFIFLDEPLGAFDDERADALLSLLTDGEIGQAFDQIFLVSHVRVDESAFNYRIRMEGGRVVEHNLPTAEPEMG